MTHKLKIAMLGSLPPLRALSSYCLEFSSSIAALASVEFISFKKIYPAFIYPGGNLKDDETFPVVCQPNLNIKKRLTWYNPLTWLAEGLFTSGDILHAQWWSFPLVLIYAVVCAGFKVRKKPVIFTVHNVLPHESSALYLRLTRLLFKMADHFIVHTEINRLQMMRWYQIPFHQITVIPHGTLDFHVQKNADPVKIRQEMGFTPEDKVILLFGTIRPYKGIDTALYALASILEKIPKASLLITGKLWEDWTPYQQLIEQLKITDRVKTWLDYIPSGEVFRFFEIADLVILPYHHFDSQSGVGTTAVAFRKPMIVTDVGGLPDFVLDKRFIIPPKDSKTLAMRIIECLLDSNLLAMMSQHTEIISKSLSWDAIAQKTCQVYENVLRLS